METDLFYISKIPNVLCDPPILLTHDKNWILLFMAVTKSLSRIKELLNFQREGPLFPSLKEKVSF